jgi:hypothetical protein
MPQVNSQGNARYPFPWRLCFRRSDPTNFRRDIEVSLLEVPMRVAMAEVLALATEERVHCPRLFLQL